MAFEPKPYTFKVLGKEVSPEASVAKLPPHWLLMDHTLAVIWSFCSSEGKDVKLGITQLQWALLLLKEARTKRGDYTADVRNLIEAIEDRQLTLYSVLAKKAEQAEAEVEAELAAQHKVSRRDESGHVMGPENDFSAPGTEGYAAEKTFMWRSDESTYSHLFPIKPVEEPSVVYSEVQRLSPPYKEPEPGSKAHRDAEYARMRLNQDDSTIQSSGGAGLEKKLPTQTEEDYIYFLKHCRSEHINRITQAIAEIRHIEEFMNKKNKPFKPYIVPDFAERLDNAEKNRTN